MKNNKIYSSFQISKNQIERYDNNYIRIHLKFVTLGNTLYQ